MQIEQFYKKAKTLNSYNELQQFCKNTTTIVLLDNNGRAIEITHDDARRFAAVIRREALSSVVNYTDQLKNATIEVDL